ncbi:MAG: hypothetical protein JW395_0278 [Nitrospira sp.]|nr:hypothetical protein [Nitrospira sp.]
MIAITTSSSIKVNPRAVRNDWKLERPRVDSRDFSAVTIGAPPNPSAGCPGCFKGSSHAPHRPELPSQPRLGLCIFVILSMSATRGVLNFNPVK